MISTAPSFYQKTISTYKYTAPQWAIFPFGGVPPRDDKSQGKRQKEKIDAWTSLSDLNQKVQRMKGQLRRRCASRK